MPTRPFDSFFANPYIHGNWAALKSRKTSLGDNKHRPCANSHLTNTPLLTATPTPTPSNDGMANPDALSTTI
jgi:hypothetical protein